MERFLFKEDFSSPVFLFVVYLGLFLWSGVDPYSREVWLAENIPILGLVGFLVFLYVRGIRFSMMAYVLMSALVFLHTVGGHYTFERVPFGWFNDVFGFERNMYDRVAHFTVGWYAFSIAEILDRYNLVRTKALLFLFPVCVIATVAMGYEIIEWLFAIGSDPSAGGAFLGSQGDVWDAQKDMLFDTLGALAAMGMYFWLRVYRSAQK